jgi:O-antigen/teichoic acid export membrane protein
MLVSYVQAAFATHWQAHVASVMNAETGVARFARVNTYQLLILTYVALCISIFSSPVLRFLVTPRFLECIPFIPWIAAVYLIRAEGDFFRSALYARGRVGIDARLNWTVAVICLAAYALFIPRWHAWGAVAATGLAFASALLLSAYQVVGKGSCYIETRRVLMILISAAILCAIVLGLQSRASVPLQWALAATGALAYPGILYAGGFFLPPEKAAAQMVLSRLRIRN